MLAKIFNIIQMQRFSPLHEALALSVPQDATLPSRALSDQAASTIDACNDSTAPINLEAKPKAHATKVLAKRMRKYYRIPVHQSPAEQLRRGPVNPLAECLNVHGHGQ